MRVGKRHILGPKSHVSIASLVEGILAVNMEIWNHECGPFCPNFAVFCHCMPYWNYHISMGHAIQLGKRAIIVAYDQGLNTIEFRIRSSGSSGVIQPLVRS